MNHSGPAILLFDGTALLFRAFFGAPSRLSPKGVEVAALVAMAGRVSRVVAKAKAQHFAFVFDPGGRTFRHELVPEYKAKRPEPDPKLVAQLDMARQAAEMMGIPVFSEPGFEADDLMATLSRRARNEGLDVWLLSPDKDLGQLLTDDAPFVKMFDLGKKRIIDAKTFTSDLGIAPHQAVDYFALTGDSSDNIAGVKGVGPKAAQHLVETFGSLEGIYQNLDTIPELEIRGARSLASKMAEGRKDAFQARELVRLRYDVPVSIEGRLKAHTAWRGLHPDAEGFFSDIGMLLPVRRLEKRRVSAISRS